MIIEIMNRKNARGATRFVSAPVTAIISICDVDKKFNEFFHPDWLRSICFVRFDDVEIGEPNCIDEADAFKIASFVSRIKGNVERIIVHCEAGVSRSAGVAAAIMKFINNDDMPIFNNGRFCPNMTCYRKVLNAFMMEVSEVEIEEKDAINTKAFKLENNLD